MATKLKPMAPKSDASSSVHRLSPAPEGEPTGKGRLLNHRKSLRDAAIHIKAKMSIAGILKTEFPKPAKEVKEVKEAKDVSFEPTYRTEPSHDRKFNASKVEKVIKAALPRHLNEVKYDASTTPHITCSVANAIKEEVLALDFDRYKYVCHVVLGEKGGQGLQSASRGVMFEGVDSFATAKYENDTLFAAVTVFGFFFD